MNLDSFFDCPLVPLPPPGDEFMRAVEAQAKAYAEEKGYKTIAILGGAATYNYCLAHDMTDELYLTMAGALTRLKKSSVFFTVD